MKRSTSILTSSFMAAAVGLATAVKVPQFPPHGFLLNLQSASTILCLYIRRSDSANGAEDRIRSSRWTNLMVVDLLNCGGRHGRKCGSELKEELKTPLTRQNTAAENVGATRRPTGSTGRLWPTQSPHAGMFTESLRKKSSLLKTLVMPTC